MSFLNARPLTWALDRQPDRWRVRYDLPSACARLLHAGDVDLGLIPSIEYLERPDYRFVPGVGIGSRGPIASVALFTRRDIADVRSVALDTSSRTSVALVKVLCARRFGIAPEFRPHAPDLDAMLAGADAALVIGDPALELDAAALGLRKIDLGDEWTALTGLPFVYAAWTGRPGAVADSDVKVLQAAQAEGVTATGEIAAEYAGSRTAVRPLAEAYLRDNVRYGMGPDEVAGLQLFLDWAADLGVGPARRTVSFY
ncbi:MAG: menaquinone biosynthetic enzyme MqnA/MqnD family protein [Vicinamibacterales bacterium]